MAGPGIKFELLFEAGALERVRSGRRLLDAVLGRLLENALRFTQSGSIRLGVRVLVGSSFQICVEDTGCGISRGRLRTLFEPFGCTQVESGRSYGGSGRGTAFCLDLPVIADASADLAAGARA